MNPRIEIDIIDKDGWRKMFPVQKNIFHIGSAPANDVVLEPVHGAGVSARHAQFIALPDGSGYRMVNLGDSNILLGENQDKAVPPRSVSAVSDGSTLRIGDFTLIFHGEAMEAAAIQAPQRDTNIGLRLRLPKTELLATRTLLGAVILNNYGDQSGVQFNLELDGLDEDCFSLEPAPILPSGSEAEVGFRFYHRGSTPLFGEHTITIRATAPYAYPAEEATVTGTIQVQPYFRHSLQPVSALKPPDESPAPAPAPVRATKAPEDVEAAINWDIPEPTPHPQVENVVLPEPPTATILEEKPIERDISPFEPAEADNEMTSAPPIDTDEALSSPPEIMVAVETVVVEAPPEPTQSPEVDVDGKEPVATVPPPDDEWETIPDASPQEVAKKPEVITLKAVPEIEEAAPPPPAVDTGGDWWTEPASTTNADWWSETQDDTPKADE